MDTYKLRIKIGSHEFEAEGPQEAVQAQFEAWKELIATAGQTEATPEGEGPESTISGFGFPGGVFKVDERRKFVTLEVHPVGKTREADALLLLLYGYRKAFGEDSVAVTRLKEAIEETGLRAERIDRTIAPHLRAGFVLKAGRAKGSKYRLTNTGQAKSEEIARSLAER